MKIGKGGFWTPTGGKNEENYEAEKLQLKWVGADKQETRGKYDERERQTEERKKSREGGEGGE